jgi:DegV family protein with EDD domain
MQIVTDSGADLTQDEITKYGIMLAPLNIHFPEGNFAAHDIMPDDFYMRLQSHFPQLPTTSQPSAGTFRSLYEGILERGEKILSLHISSGLSGTLDAARLGAAHFVDASITFVDSLTLSGGQRFQVLAAAQAIRNNWPIELILERLERIRNASEVVYTLETTEYLQRGGRIGRVQAIAGALLKIKPIIHVDPNDGKYSSLGRERTIGRAISRITSILESKFGNATPLWISVMHGQYADKAEQLSKALKQRLNIQRFEILRISPVLGVHTGPEIVGAAAVPMEMMEGLGSE